MVEVIYPARGGHLAGKVTVPPSKSVAHRCIIAAALAKGCSVIGNMPVSDDIAATRLAVSSLGAETKDVPEKKSSVSVCGIEKAARSAEIDCKMSGSTLRFIMPIAAALGTDCTLVGSGRLPLRPITPYIEEFPKHGVTLDFSDAKEGEFLPCKMSGRLTAGEYRISGSISSQFITGLLFALPLLDGDSKIILTSKLESKPYVDITIGVLERFGCKIEQTDYGYFVKGNQSYKPCDCSVEGDWSQAAFFLVANSLGSDIEIGGLDENSAQGDKKIAEICKKCGEHREIGGGLKPFDEDVSDIPDLVPILAVLGCFCDGISYIRNAARLRIKESDRLKSITDCLNTLGANIKELDDGLEIHGSCGNMLRGGIVDSFDDHRIAMAAAIAATRCKEEVIISRADAVAKSYPGFFEDYRALGGDATDIMQRNKTI